LNEGKCIHFQQNKKYHSSQKNGTVHVLAEKNTAMNAIKEKMIWVLYFMLIAALAFVGTI